MPPEQRDHNTAGPGILKSRPEHFSSDHVLRPVWGALLFLLVAALAVAVQDVLLSRFAHHRVTLRFALTPPDGVTNVIAAVAVTLATWVVAARERRQFLSYGLRPVRPLRYLLGGLTSGLALLSALVLLLHQLDLVVFRGQVLFGATAQWKLALEWLAFYALAAYVVKFLVHGYLQYTLTRALAGLLRHSFAVKASLTLGFWIAAVLLCSAFTLFRRIHGNASPLALSNVALFCLLMAFSLWRTGSLWWALGFHAAWNWSESFLWGLPSYGMRTHDHLFLTEAFGSPLQTGGTGGPTASIYAIGVLLAAFAILMLLHPRRVYPELWNEAARGGEEHPLRGSGDAVART